MCGVPDASERAAGELEVRRLSPADGAAALGLLSAQLSGSAYHARAREQLEMVLSGQDADCEGLVALAGSDASLCGVVLFGRVAGTHGVVKLHALVGGEVDGLIATVVHSACERPGAIVISEVASDLPYDAVRQALVRCGFTQEGRVEDYFGDGIALDILCWRQPIPRLVDCDVTGQE
jgi:hypothetical protein